jgi:hypothetical protein
LIKIRYLDLPTGLHVRAEAHGTDTIVYLLPGLTAAQRRAALNRARSSARMGHGPDLPATGLAFAVAADRMRTTVRNGAAAMRVHPGIVIPPVLIMVSAALAFLLLASVSVTYRPPGAGPEPQGDPVSQGIMAPGPAGGTHPGGSGRSPGSPPSSLRSPSPGPSGHRPPSPSPSPSPAPSPAPAPGAGAGAGASPSAGPPPYPPPPYPPPPYPPAPSPPPPSSPPLSPPASPPPSPSPTGTDDTERCVTIGPWGICLYL